MEKYNAVILAGHTIRDNVICEMENVPKKGLVKLGEKTFLERIVNVILKCEKIGDIYITGMSEDEWKTDLPVIFNEDSSNIFRKVINIYDKFITKKETYSEIVVLLACDIPLITPEILTRLIEKCEAASGKGLDGVFYYSIVQREFMEAKFPNSNRTYAKFKNKFHVCGADISIFNVRKMQNHEKLIDDLSDNRKNVLSQLIILNPFLVVRFLLKRLSLYKFMKSINRKVFKVKDGVHAVINEDAEIAMDVDKPHQLEEVRRYYNENKEIYD
ncbi:MAG: hypothetical protein E3J43_00555 [Candidatus Heimdallarchaeota archaeon]|nr:MAG: hypothetical protein E3J43_00555 [Candidatus Heimdallarchaeota archaeon]